MNSYETGFLSIEQAASLYLNNNKKISNVSGNKSDVTFEEVLREKTKLQDVKFSKHANERLMTRNIILSDNQLNRLNQGIDQARDKNINESLVMMDNLAFIVNVKNNTVVTAMEQNEKSNVFTNIDGAVIV